MFVAVLALIIYWDVSGDLAGVQNRKGALFFLCINNGMAGIQNVNLIFPVERPVFLREVNNSMYSTSAYFWGKVLSELPMSIFVPVLQGVLVYFALGLNTNEWYKFPLFLSSSILCYNACTGFGYILGTAISNKQVSAIAVPIIFVPLMLFAGFFTNQNNIPEFLDPLKWIAIFRYCF